MWPKLLAIVIAVCFVYSLLNHFGLVYDWTQGKFGAPRDAAMVVEKALLKGPSGEPPK